MPHHPIFAAVYDRTNRRTERVYLAAHRRALLAEARGAVLELGAGTGANLPHYPPAVTRLVLAEPDPAMRRRLAGRLPDAGFPIELVDAAAERLPFPDAAFDTVVATLVLCSVADLPGAVGEARRVLRPDGRLLFLEHVAAPGPAGTAQRLLQPVYGRLAGGCHLHRDTEAALAAGGFAIMEIRRFHPPVGQGRLFPSIEGVATAGSRAPSAAR